MENNSLFGNTNALKYKTQEELQESIDAYFDYCDENNKPYTICGLALHLGVDRKTLINYGKREAFSTQIKNAKARVETMLEENLYRLGNNSGIIFNLKNNYGWKDNVEVADKDKLAKVEELLTKIEEEADK